MPPQWCLGPRDVTSPNALLVSFSLLPLNGFCRVHVSSSSGSHLVFYATNLKLGSQHNFFVFMSSVLKSIFFHNQLIVLFFPQTIHEYWFYPPYATNKPITGYWLTVCTSCKPLSDCENTLRS